MIVDVTGIPLTPGNGGVDCLGNGLHYDEKGRLIFCCCDECAYLLCCTSETDCVACEDTDCPRKI